MAAVTTTAGDFLKVESFFWSVAQAAAPSEAHASLLVLASYRDQRLTPFLSPGRRAEQVAEGELFRGRRCSSAGIAVWHWSAGRVGSGRLLHLPGALGPLPRALDPRLSQHRGPFQRAPHIEGERRGLWGGMSLASVISPGARALFSGAYHTGPPATPATLVARQGTRKQESPWAQTCSLAHLPHLAGRCPSSAHRHLHSDPSLLSLG